MLGENWLQLVGSESHVAGRALTSTPKTQRNVTIPFFIPTLLACSKCICKPLHRTDAAGRVGHHSMPMIFPERLSCGQEQWGKRDMKGTEE